MTPEFLTLHRDIPRQGPGLPEDVRWAVEGAGLSGAARVLDAGCGPGADLETFARLLPHAALTGYDMVPRFIEEARARLGGRASLVAGDLREAPGPYDHVWCAGALYFFGIEEGLAMLGAKLAEGGTICFTEPFVAEAGEPDQAAFWQGFPAVPMAASEARVEAAGFAVLDRRAISEAAWDAYHAPLEARARMLRAEAGDALAAVLDETQAEIDAKRRLGPSVGYAQFLVRPR